MQYLLQKYSHHSEAFRDQARELLLELCHGEVRLRNPKPRHRMPRTAVRGKRKAGPLLGGGSQRASGSTIIRLYYRGGPERIPQMGYFFLARMGDFFTEGLCFDTSTEGERGTVGRRPPLSTKVGAGWPCGMGAGAKRRPRWWRMTQYPSTTRPTLQAL
jgi:hypothetical protein